MKRMFHLWLTVAFVTVPIFSPATLLAQSVIKPAAPDSTSAVAGQPSATGVAAEVKPIVADPQAALTLELAKLAARVSTPDHLGDLIKIGLPILGAIAAAIIGLISAKRAAETQRKTTLEVTRANHRTELTKEFGNKRAERFDALMSSFDGFCQKLTTYVTSVKNAIETKPAGGYSSQQLANVEQCETDFYNSFLNLLNAESKLLVLGHANLHQQFRDFGETAQRVFRAINLREIGLTVDDIEKMMLGLRKLRLELLKAIGDAERSWWAT